MGNMNHIRKGGCQAQDTARGLLETAGLLNAPLM